MKNKVIIKLIVPTIDETYDIYIPVNKKIGNVTTLLIKAIFELSNGIYHLSPNSTLYNQEDAKAYQSDELVINTNIRNGSRLILM